MVRQGPGRPFQRGRRAPPRVEGLDTAWAIEAPGEASVEVVITGGKTLVPLVRIGDTAMFAATLPMVNGAAFRWAYVADRVREGRKGQVEAYIDAPELSPNPAVPRGKLTKQESWESKIYPNTTRDWWVYVPAQYKDDEPACVMVFQDGAGYTRLRARRSSTT